MDVLKTSATILARGLQCIIQVIMP